jgi:hypothetical protein
MKANLNTLCVSIPGGERRIDIPRTVHDTFTKVRCHRRSSLPKCGAVHATQPVHVRLNEFMEPWQGRTGTER